MKLHKQPADEDQNTKVMFFYHIIHLEIVIVRRRFLLFQTSFSPLGWLHNIVPIRKCLLMEFMVFNTILVSFPINFFIGFCEIRKMDWRHGTWGLWYSCVTGSKKRDSVAFYPLWRNLIIWFISPKGRNSSLILKYFI